MHDPRMTWDPLADEYVVRFAHELDHKPLDRALLAKLLGWLLPVHDAARLATSLFCAATLYWTGLAARRLYGEASFAPAILLGMGSLGLVVHARSALRE